MVIASFRGRSGPVGGIARILAVVLVVIGIASSGALRVSATVIAPTGLAPGSQYRIAFVTLHPDPLGLAKHPEAGEFGWYSNGFVTQEAAISSSLPSGLTWNLVTGGQNGFANAVGPADALAVPVYDTAGNLLLPAADQNGPNTLNKVASILVVAQSPSPTRALYDQNGNLASDDSWFTNLNKLGPNVGGPGDANDPDRIILSWNSDPNGPPGSNISEGVYPFPLPYGAAPGLVDLALSSVVTVPEPAAISLAVGIVGLLATSRSRGRRS